MKKRDAIAMRAFARPLVDKTNTRRLKACKLGFDVVYSVSGVMQLRVGVAAKFRNSGGLVEWPQQLDDRVTRAQTDGFDALVGDRFAIDLFEAQSFRVQIDGILEIFDHNGDVIDLHHATTSGAR